MQTSLPVATSPTDKGAGFPLCKKLIRATSPPNPQRRGGCCLWAGACRAADAEPALTRCTDASNAASQSKIQSCWSCFSARQMLTRRGETWRLANKQVKAPWPILADLKGLHRTLEREAAHLLVSKRVLLKPFLFPNKFNTVHSGAFFKG